MSASGSIWVSNAKPPNPNEVGGSPAPDWYRAAVLDFTDLYETASQKQVKALVQRVRVSTLEALRRSLAELSNGIMQSYNRPLAAIDDVDPDAVGVFNRMIMEARLNGVDCALRVVEDALRLANPPEPDPGLRKGF
jgi:hypothetical protein